MASKFITIVKHVKATCKYPQVVSKKVIAVPIDTGNDNVSV